ncbi:tRNA pseudouridine(38-40) synthase TruA [Salinarimonas ramus]|uniref:tRNA pseudouridine synthase A n=1 Tax=Salinarimonas ramus TaxID=690164 RepID=A0A917Q5B1_9HYPH|nr:tRNA pseudouridine(38-40) synthase TruA [Salinarimonas ramus]GGK22856.1 tRNA pseudouridine synthase A [Salinarimonas ramus]
MPRYKLVVEYDGTPYSGWQFQDNARSVQEVVERAITGFCGHPVRLHCAGRTDAGVHATHQVVHVDLERAYRTDTIRDAANAHMRDEAVAVVSAQPVTEAFHARLSARKRHYTYRILNRMAPPTFDRERVWHVRQPIDVARMQEAADTLVGHHDFTTFRASQCQGRTPWKTLERLCVERRGDEVQVRASSRSFLHNQVRSMVGTIVLAGIGRWTTEDVAAALAARDRTRCGALAPPHGLYFVGVDYAEGSDVPPEVE